MGGVTILRDAARRVRLAVATAFAGSLVRRVSCG